MITDFQYILKGLRAGVFLYAPALMYLFLKRKEHGYEQQYDMGDLTLSWEDGIYGVPVSQWPKIEQEEFLRLFTNKEELFVLQREFIYFLIYIFSGYAFKHIDLKDQHRMREVLDYLFDLFSDSSEPWFIQPPDQNAYSKYQLSDNPLLTLSLGIKKITGQDDSLFLFQFIAEITNISSVFIRPAVDKLFNK